MKLRAALVPSALTQPIIDGAVVDPALELELSTGSADANSRRMIAGELDVAEMSVATCVQAFALGTGFIAMPVFMSRRFLHPRVIVDPATVETPAQLAGKRIGIPQYWATSSVWHRLLLNHDYGVRSQDVTWISSMPERLAGLPAGVRGELHPAPALSDLLAQRAVDAVMEPRPPMQRVGRPLFADPVTEALGFYRRTGIYPLIHTVALQRATHEAKPSQIRSRSIRSRPATSASA